MLPPEVFMEAFGRVKGEAVRRTKKYFTEVVEGYPLVEFKCLNEKKFDEEPLNFKPFSTQALKVGDIVWEEDADVVAPLPELGLEDRCDFCLNRMAGKADSNYKCGQCEVAFCSKDCQLKMEESLHYFSCPAKASPLVSEGYRELKEHCLKHKTSMPYMMLRYLGMFFAEEIKGILNTPASKYGAFEHLGIVQVEARDVDRAEVQILKKIFSPTKASIDSRTQR
jgi:hypothetical protein